MKKSSFELFRIIAPAVFIIFSFIAKADDPAPPSPGSHGSSSNQGPAGGPIDGGLGILLAMGAGYGGIKYYQLKRSKKDKTDDHDENDVKFAE
ncbi:MAG: hypothetical protein NTW31_03035 [Bacteroidetes bacterium]|nr:hypothetical protein [Bacteroidota bacterium]